MRLRNSYYSAATDCKTGRALAAASWRKRIHDFRDRPLTSPT